MSQIILATVEATLLYFSLSELLKIVEYFSDFQEIRDHHNYKIANDGPSNIETRCPINITKSHQLIRARCRAKTPKLGTCLKYLSTLLVASMWDNLGTCMNWLRLWTSKEISDLLIVNYNNFPTNRWYTTRSGSNLSLVLPVCWSKSI